MHSGQLALQYRNWANRDFNLWCYPSCKTTTVVSTHLGNPTRDKTDTFTPLKSTPWIACHSWSSVWIHNRTPETRSSLLLEATGQTKKTWYVRISRAQMHPGQHNQNRIGITKPRTATTNNNKQSYNQHQQWFFYAIISSTLGWPPFSWTKKQQQKHSMSRTKSVNDDNDATINKIQKCQFQTRMYTVPWLNTNQSRRISTIVCYSTDIHKPCCRHPQLSYWCNEISHDHPKK